MTGEAKDRTGKDRENKDEGGRKEGSPESISKSPPGSDQGKST